MTAHRLVERWEAPQGFRLASVVATTYELQADFLEEDLLPVALGLRLPPARGRDFRLELEHALGDTEVSIFFHPGRYQPGLRRSPRIDLVPLPEGRYPKLHAKVVLMRFVTPAAPEAAHQVVRLVVGSANLTASGYRSNIEVAASVDDNPGGSPEAATAVRDAVVWLERLLGPTTDQVAAADPGYGCVTADEDDEGEFDEIAERRGSNPQGNRSLHAKALLAVGGKTTRLAIGSFNLTRKGLGLVRNSNAEAGLLWSFPNDEASGLGGVVSFGTAWRKVTRKPEEFVVEPGQFDGDDEGGWPAFILSLRAKRDELLVEGDSATWPGKVVIRMRDIRSRLLNQEQWFDRWTVRAPTGTDGAFSASTPLDDDERRREIVLLADEVGFGKTFVALGVAWSVLHQRSAAGLSAGPVLVVTPHSHALFRKWRREAEQFLQLVAPPDTGFDVETAWTPHDLAHALRKRKPTLVIARMSAFSGQLHGRDIARMAAIHSLLRMDDFNLSMDLRLDMLSDWPSHATRTNLDLRRSSVMWEDALNTDKVCFDDRHIRAAWHRLERTDPCLCKRIKDSWKRVRSGRWKRSSFWEDLREICRAALGQTVPHKLPLVIVDEIHNWKNHPASWWRFFHTLGLRMDRLLGLSATPFQLGPHELIQVLELHRCVDLSMERANFLNDSVRVLDADLQTAGAAGESLRGAWAEVDERDLNDLKRAWPANGEDALLDGLPPRLKRVFGALMKIRKAHARLGGSLKPFLLRHRRDVSHRAWWVGREADPRLFTSVTRHRLRQANPPESGSMPTWRPSKGLSTSRSRSPSTRKRAGTATSLPT